MLQALWIVVVVLTGGGLAARAADDLDVRLDPDLIDLSAVSDRSELAFEEAPAYYAILDHVRQVPPEKLQQEAERGQQQRWNASPQFQKFPLDEYPLFYDLTQRPEEYRGQPIRMRGHLVRLVKYAAGPNEHGIDTLYEGWLVSPDAETHPTTVICTSIPEGLPIGEELVDGVSVTGYFFKLHTYPSRDNKIRFAPMVLASTLHWSPHTAATGWPVSQPVMITAILGLTAVCLVIARILWRRSASAKEQRYRDAVPQTPPDFLNDLTP